MKRIFILVFLSFCFINLGFAQQRAFVDPELYDLMNSRSGDKISVNIILKKQIDANELNVRKSFSSDDAKKSYMIEEMKYQAEKSQSDVMKTLQANERSSQVTDINCHWLTNMINCNATADAILKIAEHPDVEAILYNKIEKLLYDEAPKGESIDKVTALATYNGENVEKINAHKVWELGYTGKGVVVAVIDSGVNTNHEDLADHLWDDGNGHHGINTLVGQVDGYTDQYDVSDDNGHGTHCAGTVCGDGTSELITGMAPNATLMVIKALGGEKGEGTFESLVNAVEYAVEKGANVLSMSLGFSYPIDQKLNREMRTIFSNMQPLNIVAAVAAGNDGEKLTTYPTPYNINSPGNCPPPWIHPDQKSNEGGTTSVICVGAVDYDDQPCSFSSEGPVTWVGTSYNTYNDYTLTGNIGLIRPDVCAPGYFIQSTSWEYPNYYYEWMSGTSMATPCVAGAIALLLEANPSLTPAQICEALETTAVELSDTKSNKTGSGRIDIYEAVLSVAADLPLSAPKLTATAQSTSEINLSWTSSIGAESYIVYKGGTQIASVTTTSYSDTGLSPETQCCYTVKAIKGSESATSNESCATTWAENSFTGKQYRVRIVGGDYIGRYLHINSYSMSTANTSNVGANANKLDDNAQIFTIEDAGNGNYYLRSAGGYYIECGAYNTWNVDAYQTTANTPLTFEYVNATDFYIRNSKVTGNNYFKAEPLVYCNASQSDAEVWTLEEVTTSTPDPTPTPTPPGDFTLTATAQSSSSIALSWTESSGATSYDVYRATLKIATGLTTTSYTDTGLSASTQYCYSIVAVNTAGQTESNQSCVTTQAENTGGDDGDYEGEVSIGDETTNSPRLPVYTYYEYSYSQQIYTKAEIDPNGTLSGSMITKIAFKQQNEYTMKRNFVVYMQNTTKATFSNVGDWVAVSGYKVFEGEVDILGTDQYLEIVLDTPLEYTGNNLLISVFDNTNTSASGARFYTYSAGLGNKALRMTKSSSFNPENMGTTNGTLDATNNSIVLTFGEAGTTPDPDPDPTPDPDPDTPGDLKLYSRYPSYVVGDDIELYWDQITSNSLQGFNLYEEWWDAGNSSYVYEKINTTLIPADQLEYTITGGLPTRGCDNTICLTAVYDSGETVKGQAYVTVAMTGTGTMAGIVVDEAGNPLSGVAVTVRGTDCQGVSYEYPYNTGADGKFGGDIPMGSYDVYASKSGYNNRSIFGIEITPGKETEVRVEMWLPGDEYTLEKEIGENPETYIDFLGPVLPVSHAHKYSASQQIYTREELDFASASDVKITSISFKVYGNTHSGKTDIIKVYVQNTEETVFSNNSWYALNDDNKVFEGLYKMPADGEWMTLNFDESVEYTGNNLLVSVIRENREQWTQSAFYVYATDNIRSLCAANDTYLPHGYSSDAVTLYKNNIIKLTYTTTSPDVMVTPNPIDFGDVIVGDYWSEKDDVTVPVQINGYNTEIDAVTVDNPFFTLPSLTLPAENVEFEMAYNKNNTVGLKSGTLSVTPKKGNVKEVKVTATAYAPVEPDIFEMSREVVWVNDEYEDTPDITTLHDDYILPSETPEAEKYGVGTRKDAVYKFTLANDAYVTAKVFNGEKALLAFYKEDFTNDSVVDKDGPSVDNPYYGIGDSPIVETWDTCYLDENCTGSLSDWTFVSRDKDAQNWFVTDGNDNDYSGWYGSSGLGDWLLGSRKYKSGVLKPENYAYTTEKYEITAQSEIIFDHKHSDGSYWKDVFDVVISEDGTNFTSVKQIVYADILNAPLGNDKWILSERIPLSEYKGKKVHIGFMHKDDSAEDDGDGVKIDNICISGVLKTTNSRYTSVADKSSIKASGQVTTIMENMLFPKGTYYAVPAAESEFTFYLTKQDIDEGIIFIKDGNWKVGSNWNIGTVPIETDDVIIRANAHVTDDVKINSIFIENVGTLTVEPTGTLDVIGGIENNLHSAFIIEDGGQVYQNNANVAATFNMNINNPATWGPDGSNHANGWQFIASPFVDADLLGYVNPDEGGDYDLYKYDGTRHLEWVNYKLHHDEFIHDFADGMQGWTSLDANGDGYTWSYNGGAGKDGAAGYMSCALRQGISNDFLVSPKIINTYPESKLRFWVKNASNVTTSSEVEVWLSADKAASPTAAGDFKTKVGTVMVTNEWQQVEFLLKAYADTVDRDFREYWMAIRCTSGASANTEVMIDQLELANYEEANPYETEFILGRGYMASYEKDDTATLQGILNHETTFNYKVNYNADNRWENFYILGNPFTYDIKWTDFTHEHIVNGYAVVDNDGNYIYSSDGNIKVGDGIMIMTTGSDPTISVTKTRSRNAVADYLNVVASGSDGDDNFIVSLSGEENEGFKKLENFNKDISTVYVMEYGTQYGIVNRDADVEEVEFCFDAKKIGYYTISVTPNGDFSSVSLYDRIEDVETDMMTGKGYRFFTMNSEDNYNRFVLRFSKKSDLEDGNFVYQSGDELVIDADGLVQVMDVMGRIIYSGEQSGINRVNIGGMKNSACVVRNINNNEVRTQKIVIL